MRCVLAARQDKPMPRGLGSTELVCRFHSGVGGPGMAVSRRYAELAPGRGSKSANAAHQFL
jgi:hypothetical protein